MTILFKYYADVENCESFKNFSYIYIYIYIDIYNNNNNNNNNNKSLYELKTISTHTYCFRLYLLKED